MPDEPSAFEDELRLSLSRVEAPAGFAASVLGRVEAEQGAVGAPFEPQAPTAALARAHSSRAMPWRFPATAAMQIRPLWKLAAALLLVLLLPLGSYTYKRHQQARARAAVEEFALAMRLTQAALVNAGDHVALHGHDHPPEQ